MEPTYICLHCGYEDGESTFMNRPCRKCGGLWAVPLSLFDAQCARTLEGINPEAVGDLLLFAENARDELDPDMHPRAAVVLREAAITVIAKAKE